MEPEKAINPLSRLYALIEKGKIEKEIDFRGVKYVFKSLNDAEYAWRDQFLPTGLPMMALFTTQRTPTLAMATVSINGVPAAALPGMGPTEQQAGLDTKYAVAFNLQRFYADLPREYIEELYNQYMEQIEVPARKVTEEDFLS